MEVLQSSYITESTEVVRQSADFHPSIWGHFFISLPSLSPTQLASLEVKHDGLMVKVRNLLIESIDLMQTLELIDIIQRLGVAYLFEKEINDALHRIHKNGIDDSDLHLVSLHFRLLRQQRCHVSCDIFNKFLDENGEFKASSKNNIKALLSLYEAAHLKMPDEIILDKALKFSKCNLNSLPCDLEPHLAMMVSSAFEIPLVRTVDRPRAKQYLSIYEKDTMYSETLLDFAKLDFLLLQARHQDEVRSLSIWWKYLNLAKNLPFTCDRIVECYFWILSMHFETNYSRSRVMTTKVAALLSVIDDIYDTYGTFEELQEFNDVIQSWKTENVSKLPKYMQHCFLAIYDTFKEFEYELAQDQYSFCMQYLIQEMKGMSKAYLEEAKWASQGCVPKLKDHLKVSLITGAHSILSCASYVGMEEDITKDLLQWVTSMPPILISSNFIGRVKNDIASYKHEQKRCHVASTVQCYAMEHGCSEKEASIELLKMVEEEWKIINREFMCSKIPIPFIQTIINLTNFIELVYYMGNDSYTNSDKILKDIIISVLVEPVQIHIEVGSSYYVSEI